MMKRNVALILMAIMSLGTAWAGEGDGTEARQEVRTIKAPRFVRPLVERWIAEYGKVEPTVRLQLALGQQAGASLSVVLDGDGQSSSAVYFGQYAVLPITASGSEAEQVLSGKRLGTKRLRELYFVPDDLDDEQPSKQFARLTVYSGSSPLSVATLFAQNLGQERDNFRGRRIAGDDLFLNTALQKDPTGVSVNALSNIYDLQSRHVRQGLAVIALDTKKTLAPTATLDEVLEALEQGVPQEVAAGRVGLTFDAQDEVLVRFLQWVLEGGTQWNHEYGLLNLDRKVAEAETIKVKRLYTAQK